MDLRNKNTKKTLTSMIEKAIQNVKNENKLNPKVQEQLMRFKQDEEIRKARQRQLDSSPKLIRTLSQSEYIAFYQRSQSQLKTKNEQLQQLKENSIQKKLMEEIAEATFHPKILKTKNINVRCSTDSLYSQGIKWMQSKAEHLDKLKESSTIQLSQENLFKPSVNKISNKIIKQSKQDFYERMNRNETKKQEKMKRLRTDATPTFKPQINNRSKKAQSQYGKNVLQVSVNLELLEKIRDYHNRDYSHSNLRLSTLAKNNMQTRNCQSVLSQSMDMDTKITEQYPSFRVEPSNITTIKKQPKLQMDDFHSPANNSTEMLYDDALGNSYYF